MGRKVRDSLIVNNFFTLASIIIISIVLVLYTKFIVDDTNKIKKLPCEKQSHTYVKIFNEKLLKKSINAIDKGYYKLEGSYLKSIHIKSKIEEIISLEEANESYILALETKPKDKLEKFLKIKYEIIETDKEDKTKENKENLNAGLVLTSFRIDSTEIFRVYSDFKFMYNNAIKDRIDCSIKVFRNYVQNYKQ